MNKMLSTLNEKYKNIYVNIGRLYYNIIYQNIQKTFQFNGFNVNVSVKNDKSQLDFNLQDELFVIQSSGHIPYRSHYDNIPKFYFSNDSNDSNDSNNSMNVKYYPSNNKNEKNEIDYDLITRTCSDFADVIFNLWNSNFIITRSIDDKLDHHSLNFCFSYYGIFEQSSSQEDNNHIINRFLFFEKDILRRIAKVEYRYNVINFYKKVFGHMKGGANIFKPHELDPIILSKGQDSNTLLQEIHNQVENVFFSSLKKYESLLENNDFKKSEVLNQNEMEKIKKEIEKWSVVRIDYSPFKKNMLKSISLCD